MKLPTALEDLQEQKTNALLLLKGDTDMKAKALRQQIEAIDPSDATRRDKDRLAALCRKVGKFHAGALNKRFERQSSFIRSPNNRQGSRSHQG